jgi:hypothetical protein
MLSCYRITDVGALITQYEGVKGAEQAEEAADEEEAEERADWCIGSVAVGGGRSKWSGCRSEVICK